MGQWDAVRGHPIVAKRVSVLLACIVLLGCPKRTAVWLLPESTANRLGFGLGPTPGKATNGYVNLLVVQHCGNYGQKDLVLWAVGSASTHRDEGLPARLFYGDSMPGFITTVPPQPLGPGTYIALTDGDGALHFRVDQSGDVTALEHCTRPQSVQ